MTFKTEYTHTFEISRHNNNGRYKTKQNKIFLYGYDFRKKSIFYIKYMLQKIEKEKYIAINHVHVVQAMPS